MTTVIIPEPDPFDTEFAEEVIHLSRDLITGHPCSIYVDFDDPHLTRDNARAVGMRLLALAEEWDQIEATRTASGRAPTMPIQAYAADGYDESRRTHLRRLPDVDEQLRHRDV